MKRVGWLQEVGQTTGSWLEKKKGLCLHLIKSKNKITQRQMENLTHEVYNGMETTTEKISTHVFRER